MSTSQNSSPAMMSATLLKQDLLKLALRILEVWGTCEVASESGQTVFLQRTPLDVYELLCSLPVKSGTDQSSEHSVSP